MRVLVFHGYLLRGTGSNEYNAALAAALVRLGHEVHLVCQERHAAELDFVGAIGDWDTGKLAVHQAGASPCTVYRPAIGALLPVYVLDRYEGVEARPFPDLTEAELDAYVRANVEAVAEVAARARPEVALANHLVMGPLILARALHGTGIPYAVKVHGSALEYTVKPNPRFLPYAQEGIRDANAVLVGSTHTAHSLWATLDDPALPARTRLGPPGVDARTFRPRERADALARVRALSRRLASAGSRGAASTVAQSDFSRDDAATARALAELGRSAPNDHLVAFVGKLILAKGIDLLLLAWPLVLGEVPAARLAVVGFGAYAKAAHRLVDALATNDLDAVRELAASGGAVGGGAASRLEFACSFLDWLERSGECERYLTVAKDIRERVAFVGRLEHDEVADLLPLCEAIVVPSTFPESFGMVAVEAAACGALPISAAHSGLQEVSRVLGNALPERVQNLLTFGLGPHVVQSIADSVIGYLRSPRELRATVRDELVRTTDAHYSWEGVARDVMAAARGNLGTLQPVA